MDITNALHLTLQDEDAHTKQEISFELFCIFLCAKNKTKRSFFNLVNNSSKSMEHILSVAGDVYNIIICYSKLCVQNCTVPCI